MSVKKIHPIVWSFSSESSSFLLLRFRWLLEPFKPRSLWVIFPMIFKSKINFSNLFIPCVHRIVLDYQFSQILIAHRPDAVGVGLFAKILAISLHIPVWAVNHFFAPVIYKVITFFANYILWHNHSPFGGSGRSCCHIQQSTSSASTPSRLSAY